MAVSRHWNGDRRGGFDAAENVIEAIELGATTVMLGSALLGGYGIITETVRRLEE